MKLLHKSISKRKIVGSGLLFLILIGLLFPQNFTNPVLGADNKSYNSKSFWFYPWGESGTHKGVDIFAKEGTIVQSSTSGLVLFTGEINMGGKVVLILGPKWRLHYYAHLHEINTQTFAWTSIKEKIGKVGTTGNAKGKPPHLHYSIVSLLPYFWKVENTTQGWKKMFYLNPIDYLK
jgi:peptidoglycan LD-endopeptidase LytH